MTSTQASRSEVLPPCTKRNVLYENICTKCNPGVGEKKFKLNPPNHPPSVYVGESARSLYERGKEHWRDFKNKHEDSHILKHHQIHHGGLGDPSFHLRPIKFLNAPLTRQISEAVRIERMGEDILLNSKGEYNRCTLGRLTIGEVVEDNKEDNQISKLEEERRGAIEDNTKEWESSKLVKRRAEELLGRVDLTRGISRSPARKRLNKEREEEGSQKKKKNNTRKLQYPLIEDNWGEEKPEEVPQSPTVAKTPPNWGGKPPSPGGITSPSVPTTTHHHPDDDNLCRNTTTTPPTSTNTNHPQNQENKLEEDPTTVEDDPGASKDEQNPPTNKEGNLESMVIKEDNTKNKEDNRVYKQSDGQTDEIRTMNNKKRSITVNGIDLMEIMRRKKLEGTKKTDKGTKKTDKQKNTNNKKTIQEETPTGQIQKYLISEKKKKENNEKLTFETAEKLSVKENIKRFQRMSESREGACVMGSGRCATHNVKLVREISTKKSSFVNKSGQISWTERESIRMKCPAASNQAVTYGGGVMMTSYLDKQDGAIKKRRLSGNEEMNQSEAIGTVLSEKTDL